MLIVSRNFSLSRRLRLDAQLLPRDIGRAPRAFDEARSLQIAGITRAHARPVAYAQPLLDPPRAALARKCVDVTPTELGHPLARSLTARIVGDQSGDEIGFRRGMIALDADQRLAEQVADNAGGLPGLGKDEIG